MISSKLFIFVRSYLNEELLLVNKFFQLLELDLEFSASIHQLPTRVSFKTHQFH